MKKMGCPGFVLAAGLAFSGAAHAADFKLGVAGPMTGPNAAFGAQLQKGTEQAVDDINAKGGILGNKITLDVGDDVSDPKQGVSVANKFVGDGVKYVVGHFNSGVTIPASDVYLENNMLMITPSATNPTLTEKGKWDVFRTCGRDDQQGMVAAKYIETTLKGKKIAILHDKTTYGKGLADATMDVARQGRHQAGSVRGREHRREGLFGGRFQDEGVGRRDRLLGRPASRRRPDPAADDRPGRHRHDDVGRRHHRQRVRGHRRPGRRGHADDLRSRSAQEADRCRGGEGVQGQELRSRRPTRSTATPPCR